MNSPSLYRLIAVLHLFEGRNLGVLQLVLSGIGIYASWDDVVNRKGYVTTYAVGCFIWVVLDTLYLLLLVAATSEGMRKAAVGLVVSNTFPNLSTSLDSFFTALATDATLFSLFSAFTGVFFDAMATYWAIALHRDVLEAESSSIIRTPLLRPHTNPPRSGIAGFGSLSRPTPSTQTSPRNVNPFTGRGHRLGFADT